jgi:hypothetical protein
VTSWERDVIRLLLGVTREPEREREPLARVMPVLKTWGWSATLISSLRIVALFACLDIFTCAVW